MAQTMDVLTVTFPRWKMRVLMVVARIVGLVPVPRFRNWCADTVCPVLARWAMRGAKIK